MTKMSVRSGDTKPVANPIKCRLIIGLLLFAAGLTGCISQSDYDTLQAQNQQLQTQNKQLQAQNQGLQAQNQGLQQKVAAQSADISRLRGAIKYTVNSDLLFPSGGWEMSAQGKQIIARIASQLAPFQQNKILANGYTDDVPVSRALQRQGITSNQVLSERRAQTVMGYLISQGVKPNLVAARGFGDANPVPSNATARGRAQNRRVELTLATSGS
jgi:chemotaxis protein MotB